MKGATLFLIALTLIGLPLAAQQPTPLNTGDVSASLTGQTWAVVVGISEYTYVDRLRYADKDAEAFYQFLLSPAGGGVPKANSTLLTNERATTAQIVKAFDNLTVLVKPGDRVILYFAGHGDQETRTIAQRGFLLTYDTFNSNYMAGALPVIFFQDYIATFSTKYKANVMVFLDACHAGKLAGNEYGGVQLTGEQLARQVGNETKLMACQTGEISLEGKQWGDGHGAFTYHLVRGLQGLADANGDGQVTLRETERYLEDHVSPEAMPVKQTPFKIGEAGAVLSKVDAPTLMALKTNQPLPTFASVAGRGFVEDVLAKADSQTVVAYRLFQKYLTLRSEQQVIHYYEQLIRQPAIAKAHPFLSRDLAAFLTDEAQTILNNYLTNQEPDALSTEKCAHLSEQLVYAARILGPGSAFHKPMLSRSAFFAGLKAKFAEDTLSTLQAFKEAITVDSTAAFVYNEQGTFLNDIKKDAEAEAAYRAGLHFAPNWAVLHNNLGVTLKSKGQLIEAETAYRKAIQLKPDFAKAYNNLGVVLVELKQFVEAERVYRKAIQLKPDYASPYYNLAMLMEDLNRLVEAEGAYRKTIQLKPDFATAYVNLGVLLTSMKRPLEAEATYRKAVQLKPDFATAYNNLGVLLEDLKQPVEAEIAYRQAIQFRPDYANALNHLGILLKNLKRPIEAEATFRQAIQRQPDDSRAYNNLGILLKNLKRPVEAEAAYRKSIQLQPEEASTYYNLGILLHGIKQFAEADVAYRKAIQLKPDYDGAYYNLGLLFYNQQNYKEASTQFKHYSELQPTDTEGWNYWGLCSLHLKEYGTAKICFEKIVQLAPNDTLAPYDLACLYSLQNQPVEALVWLEKALQKGYANFTHMAEDADLDNIRQTDDFKTLMKKYQKKE